MARNDSIEVSPKYGVNPCIPICFWCGKQKNEVALLGRIRMRDKNGRIINNSDMEAPHSAVLDYGPCDDCRSDWNKGVPLIGVTRMLPVTVSRPPIQTSGNDGLFPTGKIAVITHTAAKCMMGTDSVPETGKPILVDDVVLDQIFEEAEKPEN